MAALILGVGTTLSILVFWLLVPQSVAGDKVTYRFIVARIKDDMQRLLDGQYHIRFLVQTLTLLGGNWTAAQFEAVTKTYFK